MHQKTKKKMVVYKIRNNIIAIVLTICSLTMKVKSNANRYKFAATTCPISNIKCYTNNITEMDNSPSLSKYTEYVRIENTTTCEETGLNAMTYDDCTRVAQNKSGIYRTYIESQTYDPVEFIENIVRITNGTCTSEGYESLSTQVSNMLLSNLFLNIYILKSYSNYYNVSYIYYRNVS